MKKTSLFKKRNFDKIYHIHKPLYYNSKNTVYLTEYTHVVSKPIVVVGLTIIVLAINLRTQGFGHIYWKSKLLFLWNVGHYEDIFIFMYIETLLLFTITKNYIFY